jgi:chromosome segregation ATPase
MYHSWSRAAALSARIRNAELAAVETQSNYERALRDERSASPAFQDAQHNLKLLFSQIANLDDRVVSLGEQIAMLDEDLLGASPLEEIASRLAFLNHAREKPADLEASRSGRELDLKQVEELAARCAKDVEALRNIQNQVRHGYRTTGPANSTVGRAGTRHLRESQCSGFTG